MATAKHKTSQPGDTRSIGDLLKSHRRLGLFGREREWRRLAALLEPECASAVALLHGPAGIGKTALLGALARTAEERGLSVLEYDATSAAVPGQDWSILMEPDGADLLLVDGFAFGSAAESELREIGLSVLPAHTRIVLVGRWSPEPAWRTDPGWRNLVTEIALAELDRAAVEEWLKSRSADSRRSADVMTLTGGNPLLVGLAVERQRSESEALVDVNDNAAMANLLLQRYLQDCVDAIEEEALHAACLVARLDGDLLDAMLRGRETQRAWDWLIHHPAVSVESRGLRLPSHLAELLRIAFKGRAPVRHRALMQQALHHLGTRVKQDLSTSGVEEFLYALREIPEFRQAFPSEAIDHFHITAAEPGDEVTLEDIVKRRYGPEATHWFRSWFARTPETVAVLRDHQRGIHGFSFYLDADILRETGGQTDPAVQAFNRYAAERVVPQSGEEAHLCRYLVVDPEHGDDSSAYTCLRCYNAFYAFNTPRLAFSATVTADTRSARVAAQIGGVPPLEGTEFEQDGQGMMLIGHDWRLQPPKAWLHDVIDRTLGSKALARMQPPQQPAPDRAGFEQAVRAALDALRRGEAVDIDDWGHTRLLASPTASESEHNPAERVRALVVEAIERLTQDTSTVTAGRAVYMTYIEPAGKQRAIAHDMNLAYGTYRRRLREGIAALVEDLWRRELEALKPSEGD